jgi:hypothetical protein
VAAYLGEQPNVNSGGAERCAWGRASPRAERPSRFKRYRCRGEPGSIRLMPRDRSCPVRANRCQSSGWVLNFLECESTCEACGGLRRASRVAKEPVAQVVGQGSNAS